MAALGEKQDTCDEMKEFAARLKHGGSCRRIFFIRPCDFLSNLSVSDYRPYRESFSYDLRFRFACTHSGCNQQLDQ